MAQTLALPIICPQQRASFKPKRQQSEMLLTAFFAPGCNLNDTGMMSTCHIGACEFSKVRPARSQISAYFYVVNVFSEVLGMIIAQLAKRHPIRVQRVKASTLALPFSLS